MQWWSLYYKKAKAKLKVQQMEREGRNKLITIYLDMMIKSQFNQSYINRDGSLKITNVTMAPKSSSY